MRGRAAHTIYGWPRCVVILLEELQRLMARLEGQGEGVCWLPQASVIPNECAACWFLSSKTNQTELIQNGLK